MASPDKCIRIYQELATCYEQIGEAQVRDRFLVLAAESALSAGRPEEAETIRGRLLQLNPHHLLKPYASLTQAMESADVKSYVDGLRRTYPRENAEQMLESIRAGAPPGSTGAGPKSDAAKSDGAKSVERKAEADALARLSFPPPVTAPATALAPRTQTAVSPSVTPTPPEPAVPAPVKKESRLEPPIPFVADVARPRPSVAVSPASEPTDRPRRRPARGPNVIATGLFLLVLIAGLALAMYTLLKPFL